MGSGIGITFYFGIGDGFDLPPAAPPRTPSPEPRPKSRRRVSPPCDQLSRSPDDSGGRWKMNGREYRRDAEGRVWVKKLPQPAPTEARPESPEWKTPPSPGKAPTGGKNAGTPPPAPAELNDSPQTPKAQP